uniref:Uncharacterized protein n=1 Tax=Candidatus Kentrum eta TaxID=2126337 RepID=A0A450VLA6_9GAMM|nr:MAG: hypothetical protein BECKH772A_GA0070896_102814 [Candidatus Kentron sp. H]VFK05573.1 MAG: hypothetical protein BECKH772C_GA0070978_102834 [Candidatus Kentron sp. H]
MRILFVANLPKTTMLVSIMKHAMAIFSYGIRGLLIRWRKKSVIPDETAREDSPVGFILKYEHMRGYYDPSLWEWTQSVKE